MTTMTKTPSGKTCYAYGQGYLKSPLIQSCLSLSVYLGHCPSLSQDGGSPMLAAKPSPVSSSSGCLASFELVD